MQKPCGTAHNKNTDLEKRDSTRAEQRTNPNNNLWITRCKYDGKEPMQTREQKYGIYVSNIYEPTILAIVRTWRTSADSDR